MLTLITDTSDNDTKTTSNTTTVKTLDNNSGLDYAKGHVCLFIDDVTSSSIHSSHSYTKQNNNSNHGDMFKTKNGIVYQRVRLNGILISQNNGNMSIWLDDGTDTIRVILSPRLLARVDALKLIISASVTVFGLVKHVDNEFVIQCGGFKVDTDITNEVYHSIKVLSYQSSLPPIPTILATKAMTATEDKENINLKDKNGNVKNTIAQKPATLFHSLSSQPSPPPSHPVELIISTPEQKKPQTSSYKTEAATAGGMISQFLWSPEQPLATSTPLLKDTLRESPLRIQSNKNNRTPNNNNIMLLDDDDDDDDDIFGELNISFSRIEKEATITRSKPQKRRWKP